MFWVQLCFFLQIFGIFGVKYFDNLSFPSGVGWSSFGATTLELSTLWLCSLSHTCHTTVLPANERYMPGYVPKAIPRAVLYKIMLYAILYWLQFPPTPPLQHGIHGAKIWYNARSNTCCQGGVQEKPSSSSSFTVHFFTTVLADWPFPPSFWNKTRCSLSMLHIPAVSHKCLLEHCTRHCDDA